MHFEIFDTPTHQTAGVCDEPDMLLDYKMLLKHRSYEHQAAASFEQVAKHWPAFTNAIHSIFVHQHTRSIVWVVGLACLWC